MANNLSATEKAMTFLCRRNPLMDLDISQEHYVFLLMEFEDNKGEDALQALAGFYVWAIDNLKGEKCTEAIVSTFAHDLGDRKEPTALPRSSSYLQFWVSELQNHA